MLSHHLLLFFDISGGELLVIMVVVFVVFGPKRLPEIARKMGRVMNEVKKATSDITREFKEETDGIKKEFLSAYLGGDGPRVAIKVMPSKGNKEPYNAVRINDIEFRKRIESLV